MKKKMTTVTFKGTPEQEAELLKVIETTRIWKGR